MEIQGSSKFQMKLRDAIRIAINVMESHKEECRHFGRISDDPDTLASLSEDIDKCTHAIQLLQTIELPDESL
jgi:hypothetical protein